MADTTAQDIEAVRKVMASSEAFPEATKTVFLDGLPGSIVGTAGLLVQAALQDAKAAAETACKDTETSLQATEKDLVEAKAALEAAESASKAADEEYQRSIEAHAAAAKLLKESEKGHKVAEHKNSHQVKEWSELRDQHSSLASIVEGSLEMLVSGGWEDAEVMEASLAAVKERLEKSHTDKVLVAAASPALGCKPESRAPFDVITVEEVKRSMNAELTKLQEQVAAVAPVEKSTRSELLGLWAIYDCAREDVHQASTAETAAKKGQKRAHDELSRAKKTVERLEHKLTDLSASKTGKEADLVDIEAAMAAAKRLKTSLPEAAGSAEAAQS